MDLQKLKRLNLRQPKYIFPLVIFLPLSTSAWRPSRVTARPPRT